DGNPRAFIIDSIRHPAEVGLLRRIYNEAFVLVGVVCEHDERQKRLCEKYDDAGVQRAERFMRRDAKASEKHGQRVSDAFHLSDFFVDNTETRFLDKERRQSNPRWEVNDHLGRLVQVMTHEAIVRPTIAETAMHAAAGAAMRSACLSRQVGAALLDATGSVIATGTNEVPKAGGGVYGETFDEVPIDNRCAFGNKYCSNTREHNKIAEEIIDELFDDPGDKDKRQELLGRLRSGRVGDLLEFSRAVHAEMDALLSAGRDGISTVGCRLFVTTFPCHYCARHIVSAGIDEVQFIEPYPKSQALSLHSDSIRFEKGNQNWSPPSSGGEQVLFRPFVGVAPRMYRRAFQKDRELKNPSTGDLKVHDSDWGSPYHISRKSYAEFEATLTKDFTE
ncbi:MAG: deaminase, partial [Pirellulales bacterium]|nr:deaminase [Pirellulales bacterium]